MQHDKLILKSLETYEVNNNIGVPKGANPALINKGNAYQSTVNKLHLIKLAEDFPANEEDYRGYSRFEAKDVYDLCKLGSDNRGALSYDIEDFIYCKNFGLPINKLVTLRRFPYGVTDNIFDRTNQSEPDIARMVTYITQDTNKIDEIMSFSYGLRWKELQSEMESMSAQGDQSGFSGLSKKIMTVLDPNLSQNNLRGENKLNYDPKHDSNKVYGAVDSLNSTHIRDVGFDFSKEFTLVFEYDLQSWAGRSPEFAMKDIISNALAVTFNNGKFWGGSRYWVGERPSQFIDAMKWMNPDSLDEFFSGGMKSLRSAVQSFGTKGSAINNLKQVMSNGLAMAIGKLLDNVGRPSILLMNSLLSGEPIGNWHVTIGNPYNPTMVIGNLICTGVDVSFPTDAMSYGDFPTRMKFEIKLKNAMAKDRSGTEMMFNEGKRIYYNPKIVRKLDNNTIVAKKARGFFGFDEKDIMRTVDNTFDFVAEKVVVTTSNVASNVSEKMDNSKSNKTDKANPFDTVSLKSVFSLG